LAFWWIEALAPAERAASLRRAAEEAGASVTRLSAPDAEGRVALRALVGEIDRQALLDRMQALLSGAEGWRIVVTDTAAVVPHTEAEDARAEKAAEAARARARVATREELYQSVAQGAALDRGFALMVALSTVVAAIGLIEDNVAVLIGAMVIAPLLGPNLALALGIAIGDRTLVLRALGTAAAGIALATALAALTPLVTVVDVGAGELAARTAVNFGSALLALASGAAAALSIVRGLSATLVGVMVAVALLPPAATVGVALAEAEWAAARGAATLLGVNLVSVNLAAAAVFLASGVRPRTWLEQRAARQSTRLSLGILGGLMAALLALIALQRFPPG